MSHHSILSLSGLLNLRVSGSSRVADASKAERCAYCKLRVYKGWGKQAGLARACSCSHWTSEGAMEGAAADAAEAFFAAARGPKVAGLSRNKLSICISD